MHDINGGAHRSTPSGMSKQTVYVKCSNSTQSTHGGDSPAGMAEVLEYKAAWRPASQGAWGRWRCEELRCSDTQGGGRGSGPSADQVVQAEAGQLWKKG